MDEGLFIATAGGGGVVASTVAGLGTLAEGVPYLIKTTNHAIHLLYDEDTAALYSPEWVLLQNSGDMTSPGTTYGTVITNIRTAILPYYREATDAGLTLQLRIAAQGTRGGGGGSTTNVAVLCMTFSGTIGDTSLTAIGSEICEVTFDTETAEWVMGAWAGVGAPGVNEDHLVVIPRMKHSASAGQCFHFCLWARWVGTPAP